jgi:mannose-6-phosphate isomerase-like protein (cupin superfamily)
MTSKQVSKPWGFYVDIYRSDTMVIKRIVLAPGAKISLQKHEKRDEWWGVDYGTGKLTLGDTHTFIYPTNTIYIPRRTIHRVENISATEILRIFETQTGVCDEDDIVRLEDDYGRT